MSDNEELEAKQREEVTEFLAFIFCVLFWIAIFAWLISKELSNN